MAYIHDFPAGRPLSSPRWHTTITYRTDAGPLTVEHDHMEIEDLQTLVELGPTWDAIETILTVPRDGTSMTIEESMIK